MNHRFFRDEAARFRAMADDADREATKLRLLAMAADYEARAKVGGELPQPKLVEMDLAEVDDVVGVQAEPSVGKAPRVKLDRKNVRGLKETIVTDRHPTFRRG